MPKPHPRLQSRSQSRPQQQTVLTLDTALNGCSAGLFTGHAEQGCYEDEAMTRGQAEALWPMIERVRDKAGIAYAAIDSVAVTCGPGNFTGLRIGLAVARTFARMRSLCAYAVSTSGCVALAHSKQHGGRDGNVLVALDTKRGDYYTQLYSSGNDALEAPVIRDAAAIYEVLENSSDTELIGHGLAPLIAGAPDALSGQLGHAQYDRRPDPVTMANMCFAGDISAGGADDLRPVYMREAETNLAKQTK